MQGVRHSRCCSLTSAVLLACSISVAKAADPPDSSDPDSPRRERTLVFAVEHLEPRDDDRRIDTTNLDVLYPFHGYDKLRLTLLAGLTVTRASGEITQLVGELEQGTLREVTLNSEGTGLGGAFLTRFDLVRGKRLAVTVDLGGGLILYDEEFPAGGERYNFLWRAGPSLSYRIADRYVLGTGYRWMHVSNGKGMDAENPSYDGKGPSLQLSHTFRRAGIVCRRALAAPRAGRLSSPPRRAGPTRARRQAPGPAGPSRRGRSDP